MLSPSDPKPPLVPRAPSEQDTPRDHLANERTYLAWLRTAVALVSLGLVVARFRLDSVGVMGAPEGHGAWLRHLVGFGFALLGIATLLLSTWRYFSVRQMLQQGRFQPLGAGVMALSMGVLVVAGAVLGYLISLATQ